MHFLCSLGLCARQMRRECQPTCPCFLHCPRMASSPERSDGQSLSLFQPQTTPLVAKEMWSQSLHGPSLLLSVLRGHPLAGLLGVPACPPLRKGSEMFPAVSVGPEAALCKRQFLLPVNMSRPLPAPLSLIIYRESMCLDKQS